MRVRLKIKRAVKKGCAALQRNELHSAPAGGPTNLLVQHAICCQGADMRAFPVGEQRCQMCLAGIGLMV